MFSPLLFTIMMSYCIFCVWPLSRCCYWCCALSYPSSTYLNLKLLPCTIIFLWIGFGLDLSNMWIIFNMTLLKLRSRASMARLIGTFFFLSIFVRGAIIGLLPMFRKSNHCISGFYSVPPPFVIFPSSKPCLLPSLLLDSLLGGLVIYPIFFY